MNILDRLNTTLKQLQQQTSRQLPVSFSFNLANCTHENDLSLVFPVSAGRPIKLRHAVRDAMFFIKEEIQPTLSDVDNFIDCTDDVCELTIGKFDIKFIKVKEGQTIKVFSEIHVAETTSGLLSTDIFFGNGLINYLLQELTEYHGFMYEVVNEKISYYVDMLTLEDDFFNSPLITSSMVFYYKNHSESPFSFGNIYLIDKYVTDEAVLTSYIEDVALKLVQTAKKEEQAIH